MFSRRRVEKHHRRETWQQFPASSKGKYVHHFLMPIYLEKKVTGLGEITQHYWAVQHHQDFLVIVSPL